MKVIAIQMYNAHSNNGSIIAPPCNSSGSSNQDSGLQHKLQSADVLAALTAAAATIT